MTRTRLVLILSLHVVVGAALLGWAVLETRRQRTEIERSLVFEASILAGSLGPGLAAASNAVREFDEIVTWKLLDNARLLAEIDASGSSSPDRLDDIVEANGLDTVAFVGPEGTVRLAYGDQPTPAMLLGVEEILSGRAEELTLGSAAQTDTEHVAVAVGTAAGGAVLVSIHTLSARTFVQRLGVENLMQRLVHTAGVLYLSYREDPGETLAEATWDGEAVPAPAAADARLRPVRGRVAFETEVPVDVPVGRRASLRIGLDGTSLERAAASGMRRAILVGIVLVGYALATGGFAMVSRLRGLEREEAARRLAEAEAARRRGERLAAAGALTAGLAHEVRSPLNAIGLAAQRLERKYPESDDCGVFARRIRDEVKRLEAVLRQFLELARPVGEERQPTELAALGAEVLELLRPEAESRGVRLAPVQGTATVLADREAVRRSVINLIRNAIEASPAGGRVGVIVDRVAEHGRIRIHDEGPGIDPDAPTRAFEAFVTTKAGGAGLGLSLVKRVAEEHGGSCDLVNRPEGGAEARLVLPSAPEPSS
jgi:signal transduction histidine kinase